MAGWGSSEQFAAVNPRVRAGLVAKAQLKRGVRVASEPGAAWRGGSGAETDVPGSSRAVLGPVLHLLQPVFILILSHARR